VTTLTSAQRLAEAEDALHKLRIGKSANVVEVDGRRVHYTRADIGKLEGYIGILRNEVAGNCRGHGAIGFYL
jgi:hypothetical protein